MNHSPQHWGIRTRVLLIALLPASLIATALSFFYISSQRQDLEAALVTRGEGLVRQYAQASEYGVLSANPEIIASLTQPLLQEPDIVKVTLTNQTGDILMDKSSGRQAQQSIVFRHAIVRSEYNLLNYHSPLYQDSHRPSKEVIGWVSVTLSQERTIALQNELLWNGIIITVLGLLLSAVLAMRMGKEVTGPIRNMTRAIRDLGEGKLETRVTIDSQDELGTLAEGLNNMASALQEIHEQMQSRIRASTSELRKTLANMEIQNTDLDIARQSALEASRVKSEFLANMSHEVRTPMNGIIGFANLLLKTELDPVQKEYLSTLKRSAHALLGMINDILDFTQIETGELTLERARFNLRDTLEETIYFLSSRAYDKGLELNLLYYEDVPNFIIGDSVRIRQIISNLISNAIKFTQRGEITVRVMLEDETESHCYLKISVQDSGIGLSVKNQKKLFCAFNQADTSATREFGGTGIGLVICKRLLEKMDGDIGLDSQLAKGSTFWITFEAKLPGEHISDESTLILSKYNCVLYDSHEISRLALRHRLEQLGASLHVVTNKQDFAITCKRVGRSSKLPVLAVLGMSRQEYDDMELSTLFNELKHASIHQRIVFATSTDLSSLNHITQLGADKALPKSLPQRDVKRALAELLDEDLLYDDKLHADRVDNRLAHLSVLIVDDNKINRKLVTTLFRQHGARTFEAEDGGQAVECYRRESLDFILMDIHMPMMSGIEATATIRALEQGKRRIPIIALTANAQLADRDRYIRAGIDDCLIKPLQEDELWAAVEQWIHYPLPNRRGHKPTGQPIQLQQPAISATGLVSQEDMLANRARALRMTGGNNQLVDELLSMFAAELPDATSRLNDAFNNEDLDSLESHAHKLHGAAAYCAIDKIEDSSSLLERAAKKKNTEDVLHYLTQLNRDVQEFLTFYQTKVVDMHKRHQPQRG